MNRTSTCEICRNEFMYHSKKRAQVCETCRKVRQRDYCKNRYHKIKEGTYQPRANSRIYTAECDHCEQTFTSHCAKAKRCATCRPIVNLERAMKTYAQKRTQFIETHPELFSNVQAIKT